MCVPNSLLFHRCQEYDKSPFSKKKYMTDPVFNHCYILTSLFEKYSYFCSDIQLRNHNCDIIFKLCLQTTKRVYKIKEQYINM